MKYSESNKPISCIMTNSTCYKAHQSFAPRGILIHSTGANNPYIKRYVQPSDDDPDKDRLLSVLGVNSNHNDWNHIYREAGVHAFIGKLANEEIATVEAIPYNIKPWGCGSGKRGSCNEGWLQFEICEDSLNDNVYFNKIYNEMIEYISYLCVKFNLNPEGFVNMSGVNVPVITCHAEASQLGYASNHADILHWFPKFGKSMANIREDVKALISQGVVITPDNKGEAKEEPAESVEMNESNQSSKQEETSSQSQATASSPIPMPNTERYIWDILMKVFDNEYAVAGIEGNLKAESNLRSNNLQNSYESKLGMTDEEYTAGVDSGLYNNFVRDSAGYGLAQWTYWSRKQGLLERAKAQGVSISDISMQLSYLIDEIKANKSLFNELRDVSTVGRASYLILTQYEKPADQGKNQQLKREKLSLYFYNEFSSKKPSEVVKETQPTGEVRFRAGDKVKLTNEPAYASSQDKTRYSSKSGVFYLWDDKVINRRIKITTKKEFVGIRGKVTCWVAINNL